MIGDRRNYASAYNRATSFLTGIAAICSSNLIYPVDRNVGVLSL